MDGYETLADAGEVRINVDNSAFIAEARETRSTEEVRSFLEEVGQRYPDATHHCSAHILEFREGADDDGEPSGTAGLPILGVLKKHRLMNLTLVVTRYFGGRKLGVRGLIDAYGEAAEKCVQAARRIRRQGGWIYTLTVDYAFADQLLNPKLHKEIMVLEKGYGGKVELKVFIPAELMSVYEGLFREKGVKIHGREEAIL